MSETTWSGIDEAAIRARWGNFVRADGDGSGLVRVGRFAISSARDVLALLDALAAARAEVERLTAVSAESGALAVQMAGSFRAAADRATNAEAERDAARAELAALRESAAEVGRDYRGSASRHTGTVEGDLLSDVATEFERLATAEVPVSVAEPGQGATNRTGALSLGHAGVIRSTRGDVR